MEVRMNKLHDEIAKVAYELYEKRGRSEGSHFDDWLEAEKIVLAAHVKGQQKEAKPAGTVTRRAAVRRPKGKDVGGDEKASPKKRTTARKTAATKKTT